MDNIRHVDVIVIGAGPAGSVLGSLLLGSGVDCLLIDFATFPREKICGGGLTPKSWHLLDKLLPGFQYDYIAVHHMRFQCEDSKMCEFEAEQELRMINRKDFDYALVKHFQNAGGELLTDSFASYEQLPDHRILVTLKSGMQLSCRYLVAADGANSRVRRQMLGKPKDQMLFMEEYVEKKIPNEIFVHFSRNYAPGCFYKFPGIGRDIYGFRAPETNRETFSRILKVFNVPETKFVGAYVPLNTVQSTVEHIILIGDAGGFPNKLTGEGLYNAFKTAYNAKRAIVESKSFNETNRDVFKKMKREEKMFKVFFSVMAYRLLRFIMNYPRLVKWMFDAKMK